MTAIETLAYNARSAAAVLRSVSPERRADALNRMAGKLIACKEEVLAANAADLPTAFPSVSASHVSVTNGIP